MTGPVVLSGWSAGYLFVQLLAVLAYTTEMGVGEQFCINHMCYIHYSTMEFEIPSQIHH